jgi:uncharacterized protein (DUF58 family)
MTAQPLDLEELHSQARTVAGLLRLPFRRRAWQGVQGNWQGTGTGASLDFQDHRPYSPGDDPRYINWQAYARSGHYTMKLYRQEVSPAVDLVVDWSVSMFLDAAKSARFAELVFWCVESALQAGATLRVHALRGAEIEPVKLASLLAHEWPSPSSQAEIATLGGVLWRHGSLRVFLSDLLWPGDAQPIFHSLSEGQGIGVIIAPFSRAEAEPDWTGNLEMVDCESRAVRVQRINSGALRGYRAAYARHFDLWATQAVRFRIPVARISAEPDLAEALRPHSGGAV